MAKPEFGSLSRDLGNEERQLLKQLGFKPGRYGLTPDVKRAFLALLTESQAQQGQTVPRLTTDEQAMLQYYLRKPEELAILDGYPARTQAYLLCAALHDNFVAHEDRNRPTFARNACPRTS